MTFPEVTSVWGVSAVTSLDSSVNCVCVWSIKKKKLTMPAYCVAANCNNSQTTPGITMHELGQSISFVFGARVVHFAATPQSDLVGIKIMVTCFGRHGDTFGTTENTFFRAFITLRSQFYLHHHSQRALTEILSKITPNPGLAL